MVKCLVFVRTTVQNHKDIQLTIMLRNQKQHILTLKQLDPSIDWLLQLKKLHCSSI